MNRSPLDPEDRAALFALPALILAAAAARLGDWVGLALAAGSLALFTAACWSRRWGPLLFGPLVRFELLRQVRKTRVVLWRTLFATAALAIVLLSYGSLLDARSESWFAATTANPRPLAVATAALFFGLAGVQLAVLAFAVPGTVAPAVAEDRENRTLEFLLTTDLRNREIVVGKVASRLIYLLTFPLTILPAFAVLAGAGGIDPTLAAMAFGASAATVVSLVGLAALSSATAVNVKKASGGTFGFGFAYLGLTGLLWLLLIPQGWAEFPSTPTRVSPVTLRGVVETLNLGNPWSVGYMVMRDASSGVPWQESLPGYAGGYAASSILIGGLALLLAARVLRKASAAKSGAPGGKADKALDPLKRPDVSDRPVLWRALHCEHRPRRTVMARVGQAVGALAALVPAGVIVATRFGVPPEAACRLLQQIAPILFGVLLGQTIGRATGAIASEREKQTFEPLALTDLSPREILWQKWLGAFLAMRYLAAAVAFYWLFGAAFGVVDVACAAAVVASLPFYAAGAASLGLYFSVRSPTAKKAGAAVGWSIAGSLLAVGLVAAVAANAGAKGAVLAFAGVAPPAVGRLITWPPGKAWTFSPEFQFAGVAAYVLSVVLFTVLAVVFWRLAARRFAKNPTPEGEPDSAARDAAGG